MTALRLKLATSRRLLCGLILVHGGALFCLLPLSVSLLLKLSLGGLLCASLGYTVVDQAFRWLRHSVVTVVAAADGCWVLVTRDGRRHRTRLAPGSYTHPQLILLRLQRDMPWYRRSLTLLPDMVGEDAFRRLRVHLRCGLSGKGDPQGS